MNKKILVVVAHPDDEVLGAGGTIARLTKEGYVVKTLILGEGVKSRDNWTQTEYNELRNSITKANKILGVTDINVFEYPDNRFDSVSLLDIIKTISKIKNNFKPSIVFTHCRNDLNIDHRVTYQAVITCCRPLSDETVKEIYSFEVLSSTEWNVPIGFNPNVFFDITMHVRKKIDALKEYKTEVKQGNHPRSEIGVISNSLLWGMKTGLDYAEAFELVRLIR
jgi:LmbE family N-acetylglucosaminyl deacetylase